ncbi:hypothetical protein SESBI_42311 [Sesbania bispinosa]|nr:hypothetical protein SESBI_42311 [Sesbania bispinosa]
MSTSPRMKRNGLQHVFLGGFGWIKSELSTLFLLPSQSLFLSSPISIPLLLHSILIPHLLAAEDGAVRGAKLRTKATPAGDRDGVDNALRKACRMRTTTR